jgi:hypothetical protein
MKITDQPTTVFETKAQKVIDLSDIQLSTKPKCSFSGLEADFYIGLSNSSPDGKLQIMGAVCQDMVVTGINKLLGQGWDDVQWPVVLDMNKNLLYHSFEANENGSSAVFGWQQYQAQYLSA